MVLVLTAGKTQIIWGANHFANLLPPSSGWLVWDKMQRDFSFSDGELAWTSLPLKLKIMSISRSSSNKESVKAHPTQKPVALMKWCIGLVKDANLILDPFCGSGTTLVAAKQLGRKAIGVEISEAYCKIAVERLKQEILI
jgi:DNA modification methylase